MKRIETNLVIRGTGEVQEEVKVELQMKLGVSMLFMVIRLMIFI